MWFARAYYQLCFSKAILSRLLRFGIPLLPEGVLSFLVGNINKAILLYFGSMAEVGLLAVTGRFRLAMGLLIMSFRQAWFPFAFSVMHDRAVWRSAAMIRLQWLS